MANTYAHTSRADFLANGFEFTIIDTTGKQVDCCICLKPIYKPTCDGKGIDHHHGPHCPEASLASTISPFAADGEIPEIGIKLKGCGHEIGHQCALAFFEQAEHGQCPLCRVKLFRTEKDDEDEWMAEVLERIRRGEETAETVTISDMEVNDGGYWW